MNCGNCKETLKLACQARLHEQHSSFTKLYMHHDATLGKMQRTLTVRAAVLPSTAVSTLKIEHVLQHWLVRHNATRRKAGLTTAKVHWLNVLGVHTISHTWPPKLMGAKLKESTPRGVLISNTSM